MLLRPQPVPRMAFTDSMAKEEALRRRMWVCRVPGCYRVKVALATRRPKRRCVECGAKLSNSTLTEANRCRPCRAKRERH
jgi:hypothetical protein